MKDPQLKELLLQALETEMGGVEVYRAALECAQNDNLKEEWQKYLEQTTRHEEIMRDVCQKLGVDVSQETPGRAVVRHLGKSLVEAMSLGLAADDPASAELVACECVVLAEIKDHQNWTLLGKCAQQLEGDAAAALSAAYAEIEDQEDEHLYHSRGWCRELWIQSLGIPAVVPPPEETRKVKTAIGAAKAEQTAEKARL